MRNRLALGVAGGYWGGRTVTSAEAWALTAADFPGATTQQLDEFFVPSDDTMEPKPRPPVTWDDWLRRTRRSANIWSLVYGEEWRAPLSKCLADLEAMHEDHPTVFPKDVIMDLWEELKLALLGRAQGDPPRSQKGPRPGQPAPRGHHPVRPNTWGRWASLAAAARNFRPPRKSRMVPRKRATPY